MALWHDYTANSLVDLRANGNDGVMEASPYFNRVGVNLDGISQYINVADNDSLSFAGGGDIPCTLVSFFVPQPASSFPLMTKGVPNVNGEYDLILHTDGKLYVHFYDNDTVDCYVGRMYNTALTTKPSDKMCVIATYDGNRLSSGVKIYLNGLQVDDTNSENNVVNYVSMKNRDGELHFGEVSGKWGSYYGAGAIKHNLLIRRQLTATEASQLYSELINNAY